MYKRVVVVVVVVYVCRVIELHVCDDDDDDVPVKAAKTNRFCLQMNEDETPQTVTDASIHTVKGACQLSLSVSLIT